MSLVFFSGISLVIFEFSKKIAIEKSKFFSWANFLTNIGPSFGSKVTVAYHYGTVRPQLFLKAKSANFNRKYFRLAVLLGD